MTSTSYNPYSQWYSPPPSADWLRQRDSIAIQGYRQNNRNQFSFNYSPERKTNELAFSSKSSL